MRLLFRVALCFVLVLAVSAFTALMWDRSDAAAQRAAEHPMGTPSR